MGGKKLSVPSTKKRKVMSTDELVKIADDLIAKPRENANNLPILTSYLRSKDHTILPAIQGIKLFFIDCFDREELQGAPTSIDSASKDQTPESMYAAWLHRQYSSCISHLLSLISSGSDAKTQLSALSALMEFVRGKKIGVFDNDLFSRIIVSITTRSGVTSQVIGALLDKYAVYDDVRYYLLKSLKKICETSHSSSHLLPQQESEDEDEDETTTTTTKTTTNKLVSKEDLARNVYDMLSRLSPPASPASIPTAPNHLDNPPTSSLIPPPSLSWCGSVEAGLVVAAAGTESARQRKKRKHIISLLNSLVHGNDDDDNEITAAGMNKRATKKSHENSSKIEQQQTAKWANEKLRRRAYSDAWISFFRLDFPDDIYRRSLSKLHDVIIPNLFNPLLLSDFLTHSLDKGGLVGMLALNGIFILVTQHGFEYPKFYQRLYGLMTPDIFLSKHRLRFFQLADVFLASRLVPAYSCAAFAKRFARLALNAPPAGALICIAFIHNIVRRHSACMQLIHRMPPGGGLMNLNDKVSASVHGAVWAGKDVFDPEEKDPSKTRALESSLWELHALKAHSNPSVAMYCSVLDKNLSDKKRTAEIDISDVISESFTSLFEREVEKKLKNVPLEFYSRENMPGKLFNFENNGMEELIGWKN